MYNLLGLSRSDISSCEHTVAIPNTNTVVVVATLHRHLHHHILSPFRALLAHTPSNQHPDRPSRPRARRLFSGYLVSRSSWTGTNCSCCCCCRDRCSRCSPSCCRCCRHCCIAPPSSTSSQRLSVLLDSSLHPRRSPLLSLDRRFQLWSMISSSTI